MKVEIKGITFEIETIDRPSGNKIIKATRLDNCQVDYYLIVGGRAAGWFDSLAAAHKADQTTR